MAEMKDGTILADDAIRLAIDLEDRGHRLSVHDGALRVSHGAKLTAEDTAAIKRYRWQLMAITAMCEP